MAAQIPDSGYWTHQLHRIQTLQKNGRYGVIIHQQSSADDLPSERSEDPGYWPVARDHSDPMMTESTRVEQRDTQMHEEWSCYTAHETYKQLATLVVELAIGGLAVEMSRASRFDLRGRALQLDFRETRIQLKGNVIACLDHPPHDHPLEF